MAAPTPVSALVHSSTLVTAGVYLLVRLYSLFENSFFSKILMIVGLITMFISGIRANFEMDMKKVVAFSTLRQLGLMFLILGFNQPILRFLHLNIHALFKSTIFICVGVIIHRRNRAQDNRLLIRYYLKTPILRILLGLTNLALVGFPFLTGFYSKDLILEIIFIDYINIFGVIITIIATGITFSYRIRIIFLGIRIIYLNKTRRFRKDFNINLIKSFFFLRFIRIFGGYLIR